MKKTRIWSSLLICSMIVLLLAGTGYAEELPETVSAPVDTGQEAKGDAEAVTEPAAEIEEERETLELKFGDADEASWAVQAIGLMKSQAILSGYEDGNFRPNKPVSRVEAVVAAVRLMGLEDEAKAKSGDIKLAFTDAAAIDKKFKWAKGYIATALEHGLFDTSDTKLDPQKPASRVWVSALLVKALGLEEEALALMTSVPEFKDVSAIPAGSIGYVNVAVEEGIITGYPDETFKPNRNVTRAELASLLVRTNDNLLEQAGAITVSGEVTAISFETEQEAADAPALGSITVKSFNGDSLAFKISAELPITYEDEFIPASELVVGDLVSLTAEADIVLNASLINEEEANGANAGLIEWKLELDLDKDNGLKMEYENKKGETKAKIEVKTNGKKEKLTGEEAAQELEGILEAAKLTPELSAKEMTDQLLAALDLQDTSYKSLEVEMKFSNGAKLEFESKQEKGSKEDDEHEDDEYKDRAPGGKKR
ncbi:S-layer homology domain-containing protein [Paenibacillus nanensis]|nr:S-layer homology domain-containing protein [Paenibacillus nanensis]